MLCAINLCYDTSLHESTRMKPPFLPFDEPNLYNDYIFMDPEYSDCFCHCFLYQVDLNTSLLDSVFLTKVIVQPTKKPGSVSPHKSKLEKTTNKKKSRLTNNKFRSVSTQLYRGSTEPSSDGKKIIQQHLFYTNKDLKNCPFIDANTSIPIVT